MHDLKTIPFALAVLFLSSCTQVTSSQATTDTVTGEVWYVKSVGFFGLVFRSQVFYCPAPQGRGPVACKEAKIYDKDAAPSPVAPSYANEPSPPPPPGSPPQPGYGRPLPGESPQPPNSNQPRFGEPQTYQPPPTN